MDHRHPPHHDCFSCRFLRMSAGQRLCAVLPVIALVWLGVIWVL